MYWRTIFLYLKYYFKLTFKIAVFIYKRSSTNLYKIELYYIVQKKNLK